MSKLQSRCFYASATAHSALLGAIMLFSAFHSPIPEPENAPIIEFIPELITENMNTGTGADKLVIPRAAPLAPEPMPPAEPVRTAPPPEPEPPAREPEKPAASKPESEPAQPEPEKVDISTEKAPKTPAQDTAKKAEPPKPSVAISQKRQKSDENDGKAARESERKAREKADAERRAAAAKADAERRSQYAKAVAGLRANIGSPNGKGDTLQVPGPKSDVLAASYAAVVKSKYHQAWTPPEDLADNSSTVSVSVTIARDGTVTSARITKRSGNRALDDSVDRALKLRTIAPFPEFMKEQSRTFPINFNLKSKREFQ